MELAAKPLPEASLLLLIRVHVVPGVLCERVEILGILHHITVALLQSQELRKLPSDHPCGDMMCLESFFELRPSESSASRKHGHVVVPKRTCGTPELLSCESCLVPLIVWVQSELGLYGLKPAVSLQRLVCLVK